MITLKRNKYEEGISYHIINTMFGIVFINLLRIMNDYAH